MTNKKGLKTAKSFFKHPVKKPTTRLQEGWKFSQY